VTDGAPVAKRLLAIAWEMPPMQGPRATQVRRTLRALVPLGWETTVVCMAPRRGGPHWPDSSDSLDSPDSPDRAPAGPGVSLCRVPSPEEWLPVRALWRVVPWVRYFPDEKWVWIRPAARAAIDQAARTTFNALATFGQPWSDHAIGLRVHRATGLPWIAHFSDPWVDSPYARLSAGQRRFAGRLEREVIENAARVVFVTNETADLVMRKYPPAWHAKVAVVPHGYDRSELPAQENTGARPGAPLRIVYTGRFYPGMRTPSGLFAGLAKMATRRPLEGRVAVELVGGFADEYKGEAIRLGLEHIVSFRGRVTTGEAYRLAAAADVLLVIDAPSSTPGVFLPSKVVDYLMFRKPILGLTPRDGATADLLRRLGAPVVEPDDAAGIAAAVEDLLARREHGSLGVSALFAEVAESFDIGCTTRRFRDVLDQACAIAS
jgi:glycosyltransferase involved in cell wall biosynthesis